MNFRKAIVVNLVCALLGTAAVWMVQGGNFSSVLFFVALLLWLCNELWYAVVTVPWLIYGLWCTLRGKENPNTEKQVARAFSLVLLVVPHVIFAVLYGVESISGGLVSPMLGMPVSHGLFACAYVAPALLCFICLVSPVPPLSVLVLCSYLFEPELWRKPTQPQAVEEKADLPPVPETMAAAPRHPGLQKLAGELLYYGRPVVGGENPYTRRDGVVGSFMLVGALVMLGMAAGCYSQTLLGAGMCAVLALVFGGLGIHVLNAPTRWNARLREAEFAFTRSHAYIAEGESLRDFPFDECLSITLEEFPGKLGNIYLHRRGKVGMAVHVAFNRVKVHYDPDMVDTSAPLQGFIQIENPTKVYRHLEQCRKEHAES